MKSNVALSADQAQAFWEILAFSDSNQPAHARLVYVALTRPRDEAILTGDLPARLYFKEAA